MVDWRDGVMSFWRDGFMGDWRDDGVMGDWRGGQTGRVELWETGGVR